MVHCVSHHKGHFHVVFLAYSPHVVKASKWTLGRILCEEVAFFYRIRQFNKDDSYIPYYIPQKSYDEIRFCSSTAKILQQSSRSWSLFLPQRLPNCGISAIGLPGSTTCGATLTPLRLTKENAWK